MWPSTLLLALTALHSMSQSTPDLAGATLYEVNVRQFSAEGDFAGVARQLPRLADLGVDVLWLMPIHPIGEERRKGSLGSYYAATDHRAVNPEYGSEEDFRQLVAEAHAAGMRVVLDWVANHTAWDHVWTESHPERFRRGSDGGFVPPNADVARTAVSSRPTRTGPT
ncbi:MAG: alpha-amylase family glycosyl hydrolase [Planctomycetota bacterium]|jgi:glycosidase